MSHYLSCSHVYGVQCIIICFDQCWRVMRAASRHMPDGPEQMHFQLPLLPQKMDSTHTEESITPIIFYAYPKTFLTCPIIYVFLQVQSIDTLKYKEFPTRREEYRNFFHTWCCKVWAFCCFGDSSHTVLWLSIKSKSSLTSVRQNPKYLNFATSSMYTENSYNLLSVYRCN